jgi:hypothetical protein
MPNHIDIPLDRLLLYEGDKLVYDGSDPSTYIVVEPGMTIADIAAALDQLPEPGTAAANRAASGDTDPNLWAAGANAVMTMLAQPIRPAPRTRAYQSSRICAASS